MKDGKECLLNEELLLRGYAKAVPAAPNLRYRERFAEAEAKAKAQKLGIWADDYRMPGT
jgi:endonuclease YncB( thermonuclease family)